MSLPTGTGNIRPSGQNRQVRCRNTAGSRVRGLTVGHPGEPANPGCPTVSPLRPLQLPVEVARPPGNALPAEKALDALARLHAHAPAPLRVVEQAVDGRGQVAG